MATTVLQATVGAGKTEAALQRLSAVIADPAKPFAKVWVLLATRRQEVDFRQRLIDLQDGRAVYFNAEFFNFYDLNARLLNIAGQPPRRVTEAARQGLLRQVLYHLRDAGELPTFTPIVRTSGFLRVVADLIYELKQNRVFPDTYLAAAQTAKDRELATIYATYQQWMQNYDLVDREGEGWLALEALENELTLAADVDLLLVDGYDQFTPVQATLLTQLSARIEQVIITLTDPPGKARTDAAPVVIGQRFIEARERLQTAHNNLNVPLQVETETAPDTERHPDLVSLAQNIFSDVPPVTASDGINMIAAPEPQGEIEAVWRAIKQRLLAGTRPDDMLVAVRDWGRYYTHMEIYTYLYDLPVLLHYGDPLSNNPAIAVLMTVLSLAGEDPDAPTAFRTRQLLDVLRSPYILVPGMTPEMIEALERISRERQVIGGRQNWLDAIDTASDETFNEEGEVQPAIIELEFGMDLSLVVEAFFDNITAPTVGKHLDYVAWLEDLIGEDPIQDPDDRVEDLDVKSVAIEPHEAYTLNIPQCIRSMPATTYTDRIIARDIAALNQFKDVLRGILTTQEFLRDALKDSIRTTTWRDFFADVRNGIQNDRPIQRHPGRSGRVLVTTATDARGLPHEHIFIVGLSEGIFPADVPEDPLYLDSERAALSARGVMLQTQAERADDSGIFYELISQARQSLTLSRPHIRDGKPWVESHLWRMSQAVFDDLPIQQIDIGDVSALSSVVTLDEASITLAEYLNDSPESQDALALYHWMHNQHSDHWQRIMQGRQNEYTRLSATQSHDVSTGKIEHPAMRQDIAASLGDAYTWSATRLNNYGTCPYRFFANYLLDLEELGTVEEGMDVLQQGSLNHKILERTYTTIRDDGLAITPNNLGEALEIFDYISEEIFEHAPENYKFRPTALWQNEQDVIRRRLIALIKLDFSTQSPFNAFADDISERRVYQLERGFGFGDHTLRIPLDDTDEQFIRVRGSIDRIDIIDNQQLVIVDYKSGTTKIPLREMREGKNFQMMVYLLALHQLLAERDSDLSISGGFFWHIRNQSTSGNMTFSDPVTADDSIRMAQQHVSAYLHQMREGNFTVQPAAPSGNRCTSYCEFYQLCRLTNTNQHKPELKR